MADMINKDGTFYVNPTASETDLDQTAFEAIDTAGTWVEVENIINVPALGVTDNIVTQDYLNTDVSQMRKGFKNGTQEELQCGYDPDATGIAQVQALAATRNNYAVKRELPDGTAIYSRAIIAQNGGIQGGSGEDFANISFLIGVNQVPVIIEA